MEGAVPREVINAGGGFEEDDRRTLGGWNLLGNATCHFPNLEIVEMAFDSARNMLGEEFRKAIYHRVEFYTILARKSCLNAMPPPGGAAAFAKGGDGRSIRFFRCCLSPQL